MPAFYSAVAARRAWSSRAHATPLATHGSQSGSKPTNSSSRDDVSTTTAPPAPRAWGAAVVRPCAAWWLTPHFGPALPASWQSPMELAVTTMATAHGRNQRCWPPGVGCLAQRFVDRRVQCAVREQGARTACRSRRANHLPSLCAPLSNPPNPTLRDQSRSHAGFPPCPFASHAQVTGRTITSLYISLHHRTF